MLDFAPFGINPLVSNALVGQEEPTTTAPAPLPVRPAAPGSVPAPAPAPAAYGETANLIVAGVTALAVTGSIAASAYHGYKRNNSAGWAAMWGFMAFLFPVVTPAVGIAQGWAKREKK
jgi:hypothetical protein